MELTGTWSRAFPTSTDDAVVAGEAVSLFGCDLFDAVASNTVSGNVVVSPISVAIALAMLEPGSSGKARTQLRKVLRIEAPATFHASMNGLDHSLRARVADELAEIKVHLGVAGDPGEISVRLANAMYIHDGDGFTVEEAFLAAVVTHYGAALHAVDFVSNREAAAREINDFVATATRGHITDVVNADVFDDDTRLALVNALHVKASWESPFAKSRTESGPFTRLDGSTATVPMMEGSSGSSARGDGWVGATKRYVGGLVAQFILPDEGRFEEVERRLPTVFAEYGRNRTIGAHLAVPRFETRFRADLKRAFEALQLDALYEKRGLLGVARDPRLVLDRALHATSLAVDEEGTEAAAATVLTLKLVSKVIAPSYDVVLDRPFLFRVVDEVTRATLLIGRIVDPS